jgi:hypothetical protein
MPGEIFTDWLATLPTGAVLNVLCKMSDQLFEGFDPTLRLLREAADFAGAKPVIIGGSAVIRHGYRRTTNDRDLLVSYREASAFGFYLETHPDWERLEIRAYAFRCRPTGLVVDFLVGKDLANLGDPYYFPEPSEVETQGEIEGLPVIGLHDLLFFKLIAGRMRDLADAMELVKLRLDEIEPDRVLSKLDPLDEDRKNTFLQILAKAPKEIANERRLGQGNTFEQKYPPRPKNGEHPTDQ